MKKTMKLSFLFVLLVCTGSGIGDPPVVEWVNRYDGPAGEDDNGYDVAVDDTDFIVTGSSYGGGLTEYDYATVKYDINGNEVWVARYDGPASSWDEAVAVAVDGYGNVYVTGWSYGTTTDSDFATIKYDQDGNQLWAVRYDGPASGVDAACDIAVHPSGDVYVTGYSEGGASGYDYATVKYDASGNQEWVARFNGDADMTDEPYALALDPEGGAFVTGSSFVGSSDTDFATVRYSLSGSEVWSACYGGGSDNVDIATDIAVAADRVYVTGPCYESSLDRDYVTVAYDFNGNEKWTASYDGPDGDTDYAEAIVVTDTGHACVTGESTGTGTYYDFATVMYDSDGIQQWVARYDGACSDDDEAYDIDADAQMNIYVTGYTTTSDGYSDYATIMYDFGGNEQWVETYDGPASETDEAAAVAVNDEGYICVTGTSCGTGTGSDITTILYRLDLGTGPVEQPAAAVLLPVCPNPSTGTATVRFGLPAAGQASIGIYDIHGRLVRETNMAEQSAGMHQLQMDYLSPGVYVCRLQAGEASLSQSFVVIR